MEKKLVRKVVNPWFALGTVLPYGEADFGAGTSDVGDVVEGLVTGVHEGAHAGDVVVAVPFVLRHVVGALHLEVALRELHLDEPGGERGGRRRPP
jgi:hypothetical protein